MTNAADFKDNKGLESAQPAQSCILLPFDSAQVRPGFVNGTFVLIVQGTAPCLNMNVELHPRIYIRQPEYWGIEVVGCLDGGICLTATKPYTGSLWVQGILGTKGIEVIGSNKTQKIDVP